ncbi:unnamed protein product, partial [Iphiclides podalirius]
MEGFHKDSANLYICWECKALMSRICGFRNQACTAQKQLTMISEGQTYKTLTVLSNLTQSLKANYDYTFIYTSEDSSMLIDNFIDCGPIRDIKVESDTDDVPLAELLLNNYMTHENVEEEKTSLSVNPKSTYLNNLNKTYQKTKSIRKKCPSETMKENNVLVMSNNKYYSTSQMNEIEMAESRKMRSYAMAYSDAPYKCESCVEGFNFEIDFNRHYLDKHTERANHAECDICRTYVEKMSLPLHRKEHYLRHTCSFCDFGTSDLKNMLSHLKSDHTIKNVGAIKKKNRSGNIVKNPGSKPRRNKAMKDKRTPLGFQCTECDNYFENKKMRWKHVQKQHRDGFECSTCGKRFAFKNNLTRHEQTHSPRPRVACAACGKQVRADLVRAHARTHAQRERLACAACERSFASRASYEHHLKYARAHARGDVLRYKCSVCDKGYKSKGELRDHINYRHMGKTQHKCPICAKALATRRCVTRHVKRAHDGIKENQRDKICQQCGKAFRDKKGLREHELIHTGERPLSCEICGCTFRQNATLYTHRKRVHKIHPQRARVELIEG